MYRYKTRARARSPGRERSENLPCDGKNLSERDRENAIAPGRVNERTRALRKQQQTSRGRSDGEAREREEEVRKNVVLCLAANVRDDQ